jgi:hypothetical protein
VWARDITNVPLGHDWAYLVALMDWTSRVVLAWRLSSTLCNAFCIEALEEALRHHGPPDIFNTDPGAQFTDRAWTNSPSSAWSLPPPLLLPPLAPKACEHLPAAASPQARQAAPSSPGSEFPL